MTSAFPEKTMRSRTELFLTLSMLAAACEKPQEHRAVAAATFDSASVQPSANPASNSFTPQQIARAAFPSVVLLMMNDKSGQPHALGSGFFVGPGLVATNYHMIEGAGGGTAKLIGQEGKYRLSGVAATDAGHDLALLGVEGVTGAALTLQGDALEVGQPVFAIGNPRGLEGTFSSGIVSSVRGLQGDTVVQITAPISPGSSGGPVIDEHGRVVGVATASYTAGQNLNFAVPVKYLTQLLSAKTEPRPFGTNSARSEPTSFLRRVGGSKSTGGVVGSAFAWDRVIQYDMVYDALHGGFTLTLRNQLQEDVRNISAVVVFYDNANQPVEVSLVGVDFIPAGLARRITGKVNASVQRLTTRDDARRPYTKTEIRVLGFELGQQ